MILMICVVTVSNRLFGRHGIMVISISNSGGSSTVRAPSTRMYTKNFFSHHKNGKCKKWEYLPETFIKLSTMIVMGRASTSTPLIIAPLAMS